MLDIIKDISESRWFEDPSEFRCTLTTSNPKLCVITGPNASGKSLVRKVIYGRARENQIEVMYFSQSARCTGGIARAFIYGDDSEDSTGRNSADLILKANKTGLSREKPFYFVFDEPEIGCGEELQAAIGMKLATMVDSIPQMLGMFVVTHSREVVKQLLPSSPTHWRLDQDGLTLEQWVTREVIPVSIEELSDLNFRRWRIVEAMTKNDKKRS